jgi:hypothetical protein
LGALVAFVGMLLLWACLIAFPTMWLWDYVMPYLFGLPEITFWRALALVLLCGFLFGSGRSSGK